jgi:hypothetical protein
MGGQLRGEHTPGTTTGQESQTSHIHAAAAATSPTACNSRLQLALYSSCGTHLRLLQVEQLLLLLLLRRLSCCTLALQQVLRTGLYSTWQAATGQVLMYWAVRLVVHKQGAAKAHCRTHWLFG